MQGKSMFFCVQMEFKVDTLLDLPGVAQGFLSHFDNRKVFAFQGEMGAGKTTFICALLAAMGITEIEGSPTYSLVNVYNSPLYGQVFHFDVYRLKSETEALDIGIEEMLYSGSYCFIEWPEKVDNLLPENTVWVNIRSLEDNTRLITTEL
jgi:tRNA threonylcarbamoyladenosine biosynthesis protein TsaE